MNNDQISITITKTDLEYVLLALLHATRGNTNTEAVEQLNKTMDTFYQHVGEPFKTTFNIMRKIP